MTHPIGYLKEHPLPPGIAGALSLNGYQLLADVAGVGAGRLGSQAFLLAVPEDDPGAVDLGTQLVLHHSRVRDEQQVTAFVALAAQLGYLRLTGYRLAFERTGLRSKLSVVNPANGAIVLVVGAKHPGGFLGGGGGSGSASGLLAAARSLGPAGAPPDLQQPEVLHQALVALALGDDSIGGAQAVDVADRALELMRANPALGPGSAVTQASRG